MLRRLLPAVVGLVLISVISGAQNVSRNDCIIPQDGIIENRLDNGLSYVVAHNGSPSRMIECRLIFKAGSMLEDESNRGAAHFLEHMAFGGTRHFPKRELVDYLESLGAQYGISINT